MHLIGALVETFIFSLLHFMDEIGESNVNNVTCSAFHEFSKLYQNSFPKLTPILPFYNTALGALS